MKNMNLILIGKHTHSPVWTENQLDNPLFERLGNATENLLIISQGLTKKRTVVYKENIQLVLLPKASIGDYLFFILFSIKEIIINQKNINWNVLSASEPIGGGMASVLLNSILKIPYIAMVQGDLLDLPSNHFSFSKRFIIKYITLFVTKRANLIRSVSQKIKENLVSEGIEKSKIYLLRNRVDLKRFDSKKLQKKREEKRKKLGWTANKVLVYSGALTYEKGIVEFIHACLNLLPIYYNLRILIIGDGFLKSWCIQQLNSYSNRIYFTGFIPHLHIQDWLSIGDIYAFCSHHEGMPRVVLEYMSMGKPIISTNVGGISEVIDNEKNGILINTRDIGDLVAKIKLILNKTLNGEVYGKNARRTVENNHDMETTINQQISVYKKLAETSVTKHSAEKNL